jgi:plastocyanin
MLKTEDERETERVRRRLFGAVTIPFAALFILLSIVLLFSWALIHGFELSEFVAPAIGIVTAGTILAVASRVGSGNKAQLGFGRLMGAVIGIGALIVTLTVLLYTSSGSAGPQVVGPGGEIDIKANPDISFDSTSWSVTEGNVNFVYTDAGNLAHTLTIEGMEDEMLLRVSEKGDVDMGTVPLKPGSYTLYCTIKGHREQGMEGTLTVEPAGPPPGGDGGSGGDEGSDGDQGPGGVQTPNA